MSDLWQDAGPVSQGKIITAVLQGREEDALKMIRQWSRADLVSLARSADRVALLARRAWSEDR